MYNAKKIHHKALTAITPDYAQAHAPDFTGGQVQGKMQPEYPLPDAGLFEALTRVLDDHHLDWGFAAMWGNLPAHLKHQQGQPPHRAEDHHEAWKVLHGILKELLETFESELDEGYCQHLQEGFTQADTEIQQDPKLAYAWLPALVLTLLELLAILSPDDPEGFQELNDQFQAYLNYPVDYPYAYNLGVNFVVGGILYLCGYALGACHHLTHPDFQCTGILLNDPVISTCFAQGTDLQAQSQHRPGLVARLKVITGV